ncbi:MAG: hypothetical protein IPG33_02665 [Betaproteobacteria bacterium]|nr:hypothetical protein [Betaproteobacteria bacterium]
MYDKFRTVSEHVLRHTSTGMRRGSSSRALTKTTAPFTVANILSDACVKRQKIEQGRGWKARSAAAPGCRYDRFSTSSTRST